MSTATAPYRLVTLHTDGLKVRGFPNSGAAADAAKATTPDTDGSMVPNVEADIITEENYVEGFYWLGNRYAVIIDRKEG